MAVRAGNDAGKPVRRSFPGPRNAAATLRVAIDRAPYADLIAHAKESLDAEVCGVLVGQFCADESGRFVQVEAIIRGSAATQASTHVTFTQATWDAIHQELERDHRDRRIVGWYHTHPGFGVEFSEMDLFIQRNFFPGAAQIAFVSDPMSGGVAILANTEGGVEYLPRFWVDAREQAAQVPAAPGATSSGGAAPPRDLANALAALEARVGQLIQSHDEQRVSFQRMLFVVGVVACCAIIGSLGYMVYSSYTSRLEPPRMNNYVPIPVQIGDKTVMIGVGVAQWDVPPELNAVLVQIAKEKLAEEKKHAGAKPTESLPEAGAANEPKTDTPGRPAADRPLQPESRP